MVDPGLDTFGIRQTVNANLTPAQKTWNLRSALNVAALNCLEPQYLAITDNYKAFLKTHLKGLAATNRALDAEFRAKFGPTYRDSRDVYMTQVYNYFALPPTLPRFCQAALGVSNDLMLVAPADLDTFAAAALPRLEVVFEDFFKAFEQYRIDVAQWDAQYGAQYGTTSAGYANPLAPQVPVVRPPVTLTMPVPTAIPPSTAAPTGAAIVLPTPTPSATATPPPGGLVLPQARPTPAPTYGPSPSGRR
jgi:hypothetical protein